MNCKFGLLSIAVFAVPISATTADDSSPPEANTKCRSASTLESFRHEVVTLAAQQEAKMDYATGSLIEFKGEYYLITAGHFARGRESRMVAVYSRGDSSGTKVPLKQIRSGTSTWRHFSKIDLSVIKVRSDHELVKTVTVRHLPAAGTTRLTTLSPVHVIGVPLLYGVSETTGVNPTVIRTEVANASVLVSKSNPPMYLYLFPLEVPVGFSGGVVVESAKNERHVLRGVIIRNTVGERGGQFSLAVPGEVIANLLMAP